MKDLGKEQRSQFVVAVRIGMARFGYLGKEKLKSIGAKIDLLLSFGILYTTTVLGESGLTLSSLTNMTLNRY